jgi:hypothetical protein
MCLLIFQKHQLDSVLEAHEGILHGFHLGDGRVIVNDLKVMLLDVLRPDIHDRADTATVATDQQVGSFNEAVVSSAVEVALGYVTFQVNCHCQSRLGFGSDERGV